MYYCRLEMEDRTDIILEVETPENYKGLLSEGDVFQDLREQFSRFMDPIKGIAQNAHRGYQSIPEAFRPNELELVFGIKLSAEAGVVISKVGSEGSFQATLRWK